MSPAPASSACLPSRRALRRSSSLAKSAAYDATLTSGHSAQDSEHSDERSHAHDGHINAPGTQRGMPHQEIAAVEEVGSLLVSYEAPHDGGAQHAQQREGRHDAGKKRQADHALA